jgi:phosphoribosylformylglycinamidine cyclo-ligase
MDYKDSGVDLDAAGAFVKAIGPLIRQTHRPEVMTEIGGFGALFALDKRQYRAPVLVSSTDGVGTKLKVAFLTGCHDTVGIDLVGMCVNDVIVQGAEPLFFLDYLAIGKLETTVAAQIVRGIARGCQEARCALVGGETAELPDMYRAGEYDLAGFCVGVVDRDRVIDGSTVSVGDAVVGIASNGLHSNGYSLVRKLFFGTLKWELDRYVPEFGRSLAEELLRPTRIYARCVQELLKDFTVKGMAHITGGGITENLPRILPDGCQAVIRREAWTPPPVFHVIRDQGRVSDQEMFRVFNNGIGLILVARPEHSDPLLQRLRELGERAHLIGHIKDRTAGAPAVLYV